MHSRNASACPSARWQLHLEPRRAPTASGLSPQPATDHGSWWWALTRSSRAPRTCGARPGTGVRHAASLAEIGSLSVAVSLGTADSEQLAAVAEGALLGSYDYEPISAEPAKGGTVDAITVIHPSDVKGADHRVAAAQIVAQAVVTVREWVNIPANLLYPESFAEQVRNLVRGSKITIDVLDETALSQGGYGGLMAVGGGSSRPPRLVRLSYSPRGARFHLALVGKGITFDSGGLNLKPAEGMYTMKYDMAGAATVLAAVHAIAQLGLKIRVTAYGALAENMPSGSAFRPSDVLTIYGGKTVENGNSDAEGRLVMADALARANEDHPDLMVDVATLTGACVVALGRAHGRSDGNRRRHSRPGSRCGRDGRRGRLATADTGGDPQQARFQGRRPALGPGRPLGWRSGRRRFSSGVRGGRHPMGTSRHCRPGVLRRQAVRVRRPGRHRGRRTHAHRARPLAIGLAEIERRQIDAAALTAVPAPSHPSHRPGGGRSSAVLSAGPDASCCGCCSHASAADNPRRPRRNQGSAECSAKACAHSGDGTTRRVHSPSNATSSRVV